MQKLKLGHQLIHAFDEAVRVLVWIFEGRPQPDGAHFKATRIIARASYVVRMSCIDADRGQSSLQDFSRGGIKSNQSKRMRAVMNEGGHSGEQCKGLVCCEEQQCWLRCFSSQWWKHRLSVQRSQSQLILRVSSAQRHFPTMFSTVTARERKRRQRAHC